MFPYNFNPGPIPPNVPPLPTPFKTPKVKSATRLFAKKNLGAVKKYSLSSILNTSTKAINTFNSFIPIYHEMKPLVENTKGITKTLKSAFIKKKDQKVSTTKKDREVVEPEIVEAKKPVEEEIEYKNQKNPANPFFG